MDQCHNCHASAPSRSQGFDWESVCPECGNLTWLAPENVIQCAVTKLTRFGIIVELGDRVEGLVHISELTNAPIDHPSQIAAEGDLVTARVLRINLSDRKIGLSLKRVHVG